MPSQLHTCFCSSYCLLTRSPSRLQHSAYLDLYHIQSIHVQPLQLLHHSGHSHNLYLISAHVDPPVWERRISQSVAWQWIAFPIQPSSPSCLTSSASSSIALAVISLWISMIRELLLYFLASCKEWVKKHKDHNHASYQIVDIIIVIGFSFTWSS